MKLKSYSKYICFMLKVLALLVLKISYSTVARTLIPTPDLDFNSNTNFSYAPYVTQESVSSVTELAFGAKEDHLNTKLKSVDGTDINEDGLEVQSLVNVENIQRGFNTHPPDGKCSYEKCLNICQIIYMSVPEVVAQCLDKNCYCFLTDQLFPPSLKEFLMTTKFFGMTQQYE